VINRRQARYILHNVNEVSRILQSGLGREQLHDIPVSRGITTTDDTGRSRFIASCRNLINGFYNHCIQYIPSVLAICVVTMFLFYY